MKSCSSVGPHQQNWDYYNTQHFPFFSTFLLQLAPRHCCIICLCALQFFSWYLLCGFHVTGSAITCWNNSPSPWVVSKPYSKGIENWTLLQTNKPNTRLLVMRYVYLILHFHSSGSGRRTLRTPIVVGCFTTDSNIVFL